MAFMHYSVHSINCNADLELDKTIYSSLYKMCASNIPAYTDVLRKRSLQ